MAAFVAHELRTRSPLIRLGILRSGRSSLYLQQLRGWSSLETGLAIFPAGLLVASLAPRLAPLVGRFGVTRLVVTGLTSLAVAYALFMPIGLDSGYATAMLPTRTRASEARRRRSSRGSTRRSRCR